MEKVDKRNMILKEDMYKVLLTLSFPIMINSIIQTLYNLVDGYFVGMISTVHFAATSFVWPINFLFVSIGMGLSVAGTSILSQLIGAGKEEEASKYGTQLVGLTLIMSILFAVIGYIIAPSMIRLMGAEGDFFDYGNTYLRITFFDLPFMFLYFNINSIMNSQGDTVTPMILSGGSAIINVILDKIFILDLGYGIAGAAWATVIARAVLAFVGVFILMGKKNKIRIDFRGFKFNRKIVEEISKIAIPATTGQSGAALGFIILNKFIGSYGTSTVAAFGMVNRITGLIMQPAMGIGTALTAIIGQNLGADQMERAEEGFKKALKLTILIGLVGCIFLIVFDSEIINFFIKSKDDPSVISQSIVYLFYTALSMPLMGIFSVFQGLFQGSGHTEYSMVMEIGRLWFVRLPMILIFKNFSNLGSTGIWISMSTSNLIVCVYGYTVYRMGNWKQQKIR